MPPTRSEDSKSTTGAVARATADGIPWKITNYFAFERLRKARDFERYLKTGSGRAFASRRL
jgi:hypothetical protein